MPYRRSYLTLTLLLLPAPTRATDLFVSPSGDDRVSGASWSEALRTVGEGLRRAAQTPERDSIQVAPGRYPESLALAPAVTLLGSVDPASGRSDPDHTPSVLDGQDLATVVTCEPGADDAVLEGFVVTGGYSAGNGGGIACDFASPAIRNNRIVANRCDGDGGGMSAADGSPLVEGNLFLANTAGDDAGGLRLSRSASVVRGNRFLDNVSSSDGGGVRLRDSTGLVVVEDNLFERNLAGINGGGCSAVNATVLTRRNAYRANQAGGEGGGLSLRACPDATSSGEVFLANLAGFHGGALAMREAAGRLEQLVARANQAQGGEGGAVRVRLGGPVAIVDAVLTRNGATGQGGGIALEGVAASLHNVLALRSTARAGGGLFCDTVVDVTSVPASCAATALTLRRNQVTSGSGAGAHVGSLSTLNVVDSVVWDNTGSLDLAGTGSLNLSFSDVEDVPPGAGPGTINVDPLFAAFGPLADAWAIEDSYLSDVGAGQAATSPCVDAGDQPASALGLDARTTRTDDVVDALTVDLGYHPHPAAGFLGFDVYRSLSPRVPGTLYLPGAAPGVVDPEAVVPDRTRPLLAYRVRGLVTLLLTRESSTVRLDFSP